MKSVTYRNSYALHVSKTISAPRDYVFGWCTDYRDTDPKITGSKTKRKILLRTKHRVVYVETYHSHGQARNAIDVVTLYPPKSWHLDFISDEDDETGNYVLTSLGTHKTRLDMTFREHYKVANPPSKTQYQKAVSQTWDKYVERLEKDYNLTRH